MLPKLSYSMQAKTLLQSQLTQVLLYLYSNTVMAYNGFASNLLWPLIAVGQAIYFLYDNVAFQSPLNTIVAWKFCVTLILTDYLIASQTIYGFSCNITFLCQ